MYIILILASTIFFKKNCVQPKLDITVKNHYKYWKVKETK